MMSTTILPSANRYWGRSAGIARGEIVVQEGPPVLERVVSGFQSGADIGGILGARRCDLPTGGWMPGGFLTEDGPRPEYATLYGAVEMPGAGYADRNRANVRDSDATLLFVPPSPGPGTRLTLDYARKAGRWVIEVPVRPVPSTPRRWTLVRDTLGEVVMPEVAAGRLRAIVVETLNVAGPRESSAPGIADLAERYIAELVAASIRFGPLPPPPPFVPREEPGP